MQSNKTSCITAGESPSVITHTFDHMTITYTCLQVAVRSLCNKYPSLAIVGVALLNKYITFTDTQIMQREHADVSLLLHLPKRWYCQTAYYIILNLAQVIKFFYLLPICPCTIRPPTQFVTKDVNDLNLRTRITRVNDKSCSSGSQRARSKDSIYNLSSAWSSSKQTSAEQPELWSGSRGSYIWTASVLLDCVEKQNGKIPIHLCKVRSGRTLRLTKAKWRFSSEEQAGSWHMRRRRIWKEATFNNGWLVIAIWCSA